MRVAAKLPVIAAGLLAFTACLGPIASGYYQLEAPPTIYVYDEFQDESGQWMIGSAETSEEAFAVTVEGYFVVGSPRVFLRRTEPIPRRGVATLEWEIWHTASGATPIYENFDEFDFRLILDDAAGDGSLPVGPAVAFKMGRAEGTARLTDALMIASSAATEAYDVERSNEQGGAATSGLLEVRFDLDAVPAVLDATLRVVDQDGVITEILSASHTIPEGVPPEWAIVPMIEVSGVSDELAEPPLVEFRVIDRFRIFAPEDD